MPPASERRATAMTDALELPTADPALALSLAACAGGADSDSNSSAPFVGSVSGADASASGDDVTSISPSEGEVSTSGAPADETAGDEGESSTGAVEPPPPWLVGIDDGGVASRLLRIDPATGKEIQRFQLPKPDDDWGRIRVQDDVLLATAFRKTEPAR